MAAVAILIPLMRPQKIAPLVTNIYECTDDPHVVVIATGDCADAARDLPVTLVEDDGGTYAARINRGWRACTEQYAFLGADDIWFHPSWFTTVLPVMERVDGLISVNDGYTNVHFLISRRYVQECQPVPDSPGDILSEAYDHAFCDDDARSMARFHNRYDHAPQSVIEHQHAGNGKSSMDDVYRIGEATMQSGLETYRSRSHLWGC